MTHDFNSTPVPQVPTYPQEECCDTELAVTLTPLGEACDSWPAVTDVAMILAVQPSAHSVTGPCNAIDGAARRPHIQEALAPIDHFSIAGSLCSTCEQDTVCSICEQCHYCNDVDLPCAAILRRRVAQVLRAIDHCRQTRYRGEDDRGSSWLVIRPKRPDDDGGSAYFPALLPPPGLPRAGGAAALLASPRRVLACDTRPGVTAALPGAGCGGRFAGTFAAAIIYGAMQGMWQQSGSTAMQVVEGDITWQ